MTDDSILIVGAGGHAVACIDVVEQEGRFSIGGLVGLPNEVGKKVLGYEVLAPETDLERMYERFSRALIGIGQIKTPETRIRIFELLERCKFDLPCIVSSRAYVSPHAVIGPGTIVMHGAVVNAGAVIGRNCIINNQSLIEHDAIVEDHCHISTAAAVNGGAHIESGTFVGSSSCVREGVRVGARCVIGMGQQVLRNCEPGTRMPLLNK